MSNYGKWDDYRIACVELARIGGACALERLGSAVVSRKGDESPVTEADHATQGVILSTIAMRFPGHSVYVEEQLSGATRHAEIGSTPFCWVIDPIDGTRNFSRGQRMFATSVALLVDGRPVAGAIFDSTTGQTYSAAAGGGASCEGRAVSVSRRAYGPDTTIAFSSFRRHAVPVGVRKLFDTILFRNVGAACLHQAWVSAGYIDAIYAPDTKLWDIAAGALLIAEAGGAVTDVAGREPWPVDVRQPHGTTCSIMAGARGIHELLAKAAKE